MNKHMKQHSQRLNIKTTRLASLTAIFHRKKKVPRGAEPTPSTSRMNVDSPEEDNRMDDITPHESTLLLNGNETDIDDDEGGEDGSENEGPPVDSDSEDEFESDEEAVGGGGGCQPGHGILDFELKAAETGGILYCVLVSNDN